MTLIAHRHGKARVRVLRLDRHDPRHRVHEASLDVMLEGRFERSYTHADNAGVIATDSIKNIVNLVARESVSLNAEEFALAVAARFLARYGHVDRVTVASTQTSWSRLAVGGAPHPHAFVLDANGQPTVQVDAGRARTTVRSGIAGITFLKSTGSGFTGYVRDEFTTLPETDDRIAATSMTATWSWSAAPPDYEGSNHRLVSTLLAVFADTYSASLQDSVYRMAEAALVAVPEVSEITLGCPNKHYLPINLAPFGTSADGQVFTPTDEPHGHIECTVGR